jgi:putative SOS response-associated peptidase YedK
MCNLYSMTSSQAAIRDLVRGLDDRTGNLGSMPAVFPDMEAPIVRTGEDGPELVKARWGMPSPKFALKGRKTDPGVTDIRNTGNPRWRRRLGIEHRCLVPFSSFSEYETTADGKVPVWFARGEDRPLTFFAGLWTR